MMGRVHKKQRLIVNKGAADAKGIMIILIIIIILFLIIIFRGAISALIAYLLGLIQNIFSA